MITVVIENSGVYTKGLRVTSTNSLIYTRGLHHIFIIPLLKQLFKSIKTDDHCMLLHVHLKETDQMDLNDVAKEFIRRNERRTAYFGNF